MKRRILSILLILVILISALPDIVLAADSRVYTLGETIWVTGTGAPSEPTEPETVWARVLLDGELKGVGGCEKIEHTHGPECLDPIEGFIICPIPAHKHTPLCQMAAAKYQWVVVTKGAGNVVVNGNPTGFTVKNVDAAGNPLVGTEFILLRPDSNGDGSSEVVARARTNTTGVANFELLSLEAEGTENWYLVQQALIADFTNDVVDLGDVYRTNSDKWPVTITRTGVDHSISVTVPNAPEVTVIPAAEGEPAVTEETAPDASAPAESTPEESEPAGEVPPEVEKPVYVTNYNAADRILTVVNEVKRVGLTLNMLFDDGEGEPEKLFEGVPETLESVKVTVSVPADVYNNKEGYQKEITFPDYMEGSGWQFRMEDLPTGRYTITAEYARVQEGLLKPVLKVKGNALEADETVEGKITVEVLCSGDSTVEIVDIVYDTKNVEVIDPLPTDPTGEATDPTQEPGEAANTVQLKAVDAKETGKVLSGAVYGFFTEGSEEPALTFADEQAGIVTLDETNFAGMESGTSVSYRVDQITAPEGYNLSEDSYTLTVSNEDGEIKLLLESPGFFARLFGAKDVGRGPNREQIATFECEPMPVDESSEPTTEPTTEPTDPSTEPTEQPPAEDDGSIQITLKVTVNAKGCKNAAGAEAYFKNLEHDFNLVLMKDGKTVRTIPFVIKHGAEGVRQDIPEGHTYKIEAAEGAQFNYTVVAVGSEGKAQEIRVPYTVTAGSDKNYGIHFIKVNSWDKKPLAGAKFVLLDEYGEIIRNYTTKDDGLMDANGISWEPGTYSLREEKAPENYVKLKSAIEIIVGYNQYVGTLKNGKWQYEQKLGEIISHDSVVKQADGTYQILNKSATEIPQTGDTDILIWTGMLTISAAALAVLLMSRKKERIM